MELHRQFCLLLVVFVIGLMGDCTDRLRLDSLAGWLDPRDYQPGATTIPLRNANKDVVVDATLGTGTYDAAEEAFSFSSDSDQITIPIDINRSVQPEVTVELWVKLRTLANDYGWVLSTDNQGYDRSILLHDARVGQQLVAVNGQTTTESGYYMILQEWVHVAAVFSREGNNVTTYANGVQIVQVPDDNADENSLATITLGTNPSFEDHNIDGYISQVRIYTAALPEEAILNNYMVGRDCGFHYCEADGRLGFREECDDGNDIDDDGCSNNCTINNNNPDTCTCENFPVIHVDRPSWMNEEPPSLADNAAEIFTVECTTNAECCFTVTRPYVQNGVWSIGGKSLVPGEDFVPTDLPVESTMYQDDIVNGWVSNNIENAPQGSCFERIGANVPAPGWEQMVDGCNLIQTWCFDPIAKELPFACQNSTINTADGLPALKVECNLYLDLLRPKNSNAGNPEWPTKDFLKWGNRLHTTVVFKMGTVVTSDLDYITPYISTRVNRTGYLVGDVELEYGGTRWVVVAISESKLDSWTGLNADGTDSTGQQQVDPNGEDLGYELLIADGGNRIEIASNAVREFYRNTIYIRLVVEDRINNNDQSEVTLKVEIKAWNIIVDKSENPIGLNIEPVVKVLQRNTTAARDYSTAVIPSYPTFSTEDLFVMEIPRTDNQKLRLDTLTAELYELDDEGNIPDNARPIAILVNANVPIQSPLWEFEWADEAYINANSLSTGYSFRLAIEAGSYAIVQTLIFVVDYDQSKKITIQQVTKPASLQTITQLTLTIATTQAGETGQTAPIVDIAVSETGEGNTVTISTDSNGINIANVEEANGKSSLTLMILGVAIGGASVLVIGLVVLYFFRDHIFQCTSEIADPPLTPSRYKKTPEVDTQL